MIKSLFHSFLGANKKKYRSKVSYITSPYDLPLEFLSIDSTKKSPHKPIVCVTSHSKNAWGYAALSGIAYNLQKAFGVKEAPGIELFAPDLDREKLQQQIFNHLYEKQDQYSAIVTLGTWSTIGIHEMTCLSDIKTPIVFLGVEDPLALRLVASLEKPGRNMTGVIGQPQDYETHIATLKLIQPHIKQIVIPYIPRFNDIAVSKIIDAEAHRACLALEKNGITPVYVKTTSSELVKKVSPYLSNTDGLLMLPDASVVTKTDELINLCNKTQTLLLSSDLDTVAQGATIGYGTSGSVYAKHAVNILYRMISLKEQVSNIEVASTEFKNTLAFNRQTFPTMNIAPPKNIQLLLDAIPIEYYR